eukprot:13077349-Ditylum_brightwellii.AAC.1
MGCHWRPKFQPFKVNVMASKGTSLPQHTKGRRLVGTYLGGGWGSKQDVFLVLAATVVFVKKRRSVLCVAGYILTQ